MMALFLKRFQTFPQYTPGSCGLSMANQCPLGLVASNLDIIYRMTPRTLPTLATVVALMIFVLPCAAKTQVDVKDAQGKAVGAFMVWSDERGTGFHNPLHDLAP